MLYYKPVVAISNRKIVFIQLNMLFLLDYKGGFYVLFKKNYLIFADINPFSRS
ncbi:MAG: hypothetical protein DDT23_00543 [candidate division WS2 bacterium]|nr:hypothetical protein [Candidatus Lithacetigena glycinireducens]